MERISNISRETKETRIQAALSLSGGLVEIDTGIGFFDHMLHAWAFYAGFGLTLTAKGDLEVDGHHTVEDTGIGIRAEDLPRIFEKGYTGVNGRESNRATGIGLYLCNKIMNCLGHRIYAVSEEGKGTKVFLEFSQENLTMY